MIVLRYRHVLRYLLLAISVSVTWAFDFERLEQQLIKRFGPTRVPTLRDWQKTLSKAKSELRKATNSKESINFVNQHVAFEDDIDIWNQSDYWATPLETIGRGRGDCEDFAIIKYYSLHDAGVPLIKLRLVYVKARLNGPGGPYLQAHMVLAYYPSPTEQPLILDNLDRRIAPASARRDLLPVFAFNDHGIFLARSPQQKSAQPPQLLSRWSDVSERALAEQARQQDHQG